jgi:hypothetical protein
MTDKGREKLSIGELNFNTFKLGDSEVDYNTLGTTYDITLENVLRAKAWQTRAKTWLLPTVNDLTGAVGIPPLTPLEVGSIIESPEIGFFSTGNTSGTTILTSFTANTTDDYTLNEAIINVSDLDGTSLVTITTGATSSSYEPTVGDLMMVKYSNPDLTDPQTPYTIDLTVPVPYLFYRIQSLAGSLSANTLQVTADRNFPDFSSYAGSNTCDVMFYPNSTDSSDFTSGLYSGGTVWNMNNVWSNNMAGIQTGYEGFTTYGSESYVGTKEYLGYTSNLTGSCEINKAISIIHYSNTEDCTRQSELTYGQQLYVELALNQTPVLKLPTLMWHRSSGTTIGQTFSGTGVQKYVKQYGNNTDIRYFDLADEQGYNVGRIFPDQHLFTIDDDELVAGLSYKSNRNWTLPKLNLGLKSSNDGLVNNTNDLHVTYLFNNTSSAFTAGLHSQYHNCIKIDEVVDADGNSCGDGQTKDIEVTFPLSQLPFMKTSGGTGWSADEFVILVQRTATDVAPTTDGWYAIDFTSLIGNPAGSHTVGDKIDPLDLEASTFVITKALYDTARTNVDKYNIHDYINIPTTSETTTLQFGDERFFYGNVCASGITNKYRTKFNFVVPPTQWNTTNNPTWPGSGQVPHISEVIIQDTDGNVVAVGKENLPIEKGINTTIIIEIAFDM